MDALTISSWRLQAQINTIPLPQRECITPGRHASAVLAALAANRLRFTSFEKQVHAHACLTTRDGWVVKDWRRRMRRAATKRRPRDPPWWLDFCRETYMINSETIRAGLERGEFFLEYLPTISLADGRCTGAEALIRWRHASGVIQPDDFIPLAENTPLSGLITYWVIDTVAAEMADWLRANPDAHLSINVPPEILGRGGMEYAARRSGLHELAAQLILEITERGVPDLLGLQAINDNNGQGIRIALDDVTLMGGANVAVLARCNFHIIKLDRSLVAQIGPNNPTPEWLGLVSALLGSSRLEVIAEGIETEQQLTTLRGANIQAGQGFYFSNPLPAEAFMAYYRACSAALLGG